MPDWEFALHFAQWQQGRWGEFRADKRAASVSAVVSHYAGKSRPDASGHASLWEFLSWINEPPPKAEQSSAAESFGSTKQRRP